MKLLAPKAHRGEVAAAIQELFDRHPKIDRVARVLVLTPFCGLPGLWVRCQRIASYW